MLAPKESYEGLKKLVRFYDKKMKDQRGGLFFVPYYRGIKLETVWGRSRSEVFDWLMGDDLDKWKRPRVRFDNLIQLR